MLGVELLRHIEQFLGAVAAQPRHQAVPGDQHRCKWQQVGQQQPAPLKGPDKRRQCEHHQRRQQNQRQHGPAPLQHFHDGDGLVLVNRALQNQARLRRRELVEGVEQRLQTFESIFGIGRIDGLGMKRKPAWIRTGFLVASIRVKVGQQHLEPVWKHAIQARGQVVPGAACPGAQVDDPILPWCMPDSVG